MLTGDQARAARVEYIVVEPPEQYEQTIPEGDQKPDMDDEPHQPRREAAQLELTALCYRSRTPDGGHDALVDVAERLDTVPVDPVLHRACYVAALLQRHRREAW